MIEKYMSCHFLDPKEATLYQAATQVRGGASIELVLTWYPEVDYQELVTLISELQEYDDWRDGNGVR